MADLDADLLALAGDESSSDEGEIPDTFPDKSPARSTSPRRSLSPKRKRDPGTARKIVRGSAARAKGGAKRRRANGSEDGEM
jgi:hypothetical protein